MAKNKQNTLKFILIFILTLGSFFFGKNHKNINLKFIKNKVKEFKNENIIKINTLEKTNFDTVRIGSFNALHLGWKNKDFNSMSKILGNFDIVSISEVMKKEGIYNLKKNLEKNTNENWEYHISKNPVGSKKYKEYYAFIWKSKKVSFIKKRGFYKENKNYDFIREPYAADFKANNFDFTLIAFHGIYGKNIKERRREISKLNKVYNYFQNINGEENDVLLSGDFNLSTKDLAFKKLFKNNDNIVGLINANQKTTIGNKNLASSYDNIFFSKKYTKEYSGISNVFYYTEKENFTYARSKISDHMPVFAEFNTVYDDD